MKLRKNKYKGSTHIDWVIAGAIFLFGVMLYFVYLSNFVRSNTSSLEETLYSALYSVEAFLDSLKQKACIYKVFTQTKTCVYNYPCEVFFNTTNNFTVLSGEEKRVWVKLGTKLRFLFDSCNSTLLIKANYPFSTVKGDSWNSSTSIGNSLLNITFNSTHFLSIKYLGKELLAQPSSLFTSALLKTERDETQALAIFDKAKISCDSFSPRMWVFTNSTVEFRIMFFEDCYIDGALYNCTEITNLTKTGDFFSFYNSSIGISFIANNVNLSIQNLNNTTLLLNFSFPEKMEVFFHRGNYTLAENESAAFFSRCFLSSPECMDVISDITLNNASFNISQSRIEINGIAFGENIPAYGTVIKKEIPLLFLNDSGIFKIFAGVWTWS